MNSVWKQNLSIFLEFFLSVASVLFKARKSAWVLSIFVSGVLLSSMTGCAYKIGQKLRALPGGYQKLSIPVFKNKSFEPGAESYLTQAIKEEFHRSTVLHVVSDNEAQVRLEGVIDSIKTESNGVKIAPTEIPKEFSNTNNLPKGTVLATSYYLTLVLNLKLIKISTKEVLWESSYTSVRAYSAAQVAIAGVNSINPIYNNSAKKITILAIANDLSNQIHSQITENF